MAARNANTADSRRRLDGWRFRPNNDVPRSITSFREGLIGEVISRMALLDTLVISTSVSGFDGVLMSCRTLIS